MEPTKQDEAASSKPASDLNGRLVPVAMRLGDSSPSRLQTRHPAPTPPLLPGPEQVLAPTATSAVRPLQRLPPSPPPRFVPTATHVEQRPPPPNPTQPKPQELLPNGSHRERLLQQFEVVRQPQPQLLGYGGGEFGDIASSLLPSPQPQQGSAVPYDSSKSVAQSSSTPSSSVAPGPSARFDPYASSFLTALRTNRSDSRKPAIGPLQWLEESNARPFYTKLKPGNVRAGPSDLSAGARPFLPLQDRQHLEEVREYLLRAPMDPSFATSFESKYVVLLLEEGDKRVRESVCKGVKRAIHRIMKSKEGQAVFIALLQACKDSVDALQGMIKVSCNGKGYLMEAASNHYGENALKELVNVVAPHEELCGLIVDSLLAEGVMQHPASPGLIHHCFSAIPYRFCKVCVKVLKIVLYNAAWQLVPLSLLSIDIFFSVEFL
ncbi:hypothetical protein EJB05_07719, partial [Eragrostis curvula]